MRSLKLPATLLGATLLAGVLAPAHFGPSAPGRVTQAAPAGTSAVRPAPAMALRSTTHPVLFGLLDHSDDQRHATEDQLNVKSALVGYFHGWRRDRGFPQMVTMRNDGAVPVIAWMPGVTLTEILSGSWDGYIRWWLRGAKAWGHPVIIRLMPEMNAAEVYAVGRPGNSPTKFIAAWRHIVGISRAVGATNVKWMWNPNRYFKGSYALKSMWPGRRWVDWVGIDGYNFGTADHGGWLWFRELFAPTVRRIRSFAPYKPMMVAEVGCTASKYKASWLNGMFSNAPGMGFKGLLYFDYLLKRDWRLASSSSSLTAARNGVHLSTFTGYRPPSITQTKIEYYVKYGL
jgi:hypothetical protein